MDRCVQVAVIGDVHPGVEGYREICLAVHHAAGLLLLDVETHWLPTTALSYDVESELAQFDAIWCGPWGPYQNIDGATRAIRYARESGKPFLGTCAGFQHAVIEYARSMLGLAHADHEESNPLALPAVIARLAQPLHERTTAVALDPGSRTARIYRRTVSAERYRCAFGLNPEFLSALHSGGLRIAGVNESGAATVVELPQHPFFHATLFLPERTSRAGAPHPLITAWLRTAAESCGVRN